MPRPENMKLGGSEPDSSVSRVEGKQGIVNLIDNEHDFSSNKANLNEQEKQEIDNIP